MGTSRTILGQIGTTPGASLKGLRVYMADRLPPRVRVMPPPSPSKERDAAGIAEWLVERLAENARPMDEAGHMKGVAFGARTDT